MVFIGAKGQCQCVYVCFPTPREAVGVLLVSQLCLFKNAHGSTKEAETPPTFHPSVNLLKSKYQNIKYQNNNPVIHSPPHPGSPYFLL